MESRHIGYELAFAISFDLKCRTYNDLIYESTPKSPYAKNAFHFITFTNDSAINTAVGIDILLNICTDFKQSESTT